MREKRRKIVAPAYAKTVTAGDTLLASLAPERSFRFLGTLPLPAPPPFHKEVGATST
jgi:hypothetical protein